MKGAIRSSGKSSVVNGTYTNVANKGLFSNSVRDVDVKVKLMSEKDREFLEYELAVLQHFHQPLSDYFVIVWHPTLVTTESFTVTEWEDSDNDRLQLTNHVGLVLER
eukprot:CAMPEP_0170119496 /NCGR_PEP_ID=MMETSP0020_2-20130122/14430_1 /TAXON_ID=98059 /ORGANISM="Dinobryon sp., Strain UTEXLB2267" /LENGTH=106 /DNA_ID=CAMNT_0010348877 /DNA_START=11 /DNA_END=328 /DNA_ORIENTATION=+